MATATHRVRRQRWAVRVGSQDQALAVRHWLRSHCESDLQAALAEAFDRAAPGDEVVRLDRLEVRVRVDDVAKLGEVLPDRIAATLSKRLQDEAMKRDIGGPGSGGARAAFRRSAGADEDGLLEYLLTGTVRWPDRPDSPSTVGALAARARSAPAIVAATLVARSTSPRNLAEAMFRLLQLIDEAQWPEVIRAAGGPALMAIESSEGVRSAHAPSAATGRDRRLRLIVSHLDHGAPRVDAAVEKSRPIFQATSPLSPAPVDEATEEDSASASPKKASRARLVQELIRHGILTPPAEEPAPARSIPLHKDEWLRQDQTPESRGFATAVASAGLVLLHPFLPQFLQAAGFGHAPVWDPSEPGTAHAAALLHHLATGRDEPYELELGFIKILLGLTPETPLPVSGGLITDTDREESAALLQALIQHWPALKRTSIDAVRTSFLQRPGLVQSDENGWRLQLEPSSFDVLLTRLPWSLTVVKLPWMRTPIHCE